MKLDRRAVLAGLAAASIAPPIAAQPSPAVWFRPRGEVLLYSWKLSLSLASDTILRGSTWHYEPLAGRSGAQAIIRHQTSGFTFHAMRDPTPITNWLDRMHMVHCLHREGEPEAGDLTARHDIARAACLVSAHAEGHGVAGSAYLPPELSGPDFDTAEIGEDGIYIDDFDRDFHRPAPPLVAGAAPDGGFLLMV